MLEISRPVGVSQPGLVYAVRRGEPMARLFRLAGKCAAKNKIMRRSSWTDPQI